MVDAAPSEIVTGLDLLNCVSLRSLAPVEDIKAALDEFGAALIINHQNLLMVSVPKQYVALLNKALLSYGVPQRRAVVAGIPEKISRIPQNYDRIKIWKKLYGHLDIPELY